jgi:hypothetical protein
MRAVLGYSGIYFISAIVHPANSSSLAGVRRLFAVIGTIVSSDDTVFDKLP